jgi:hypothetical protein
MSEFEYDPVPQWKALFEKHEAARRLWLIERAAWMESRGYRNWFPDEWARLSPSDKVHLILVRVSRERAIDPSRYVEIVNRAADKYSGNPSQTVRPFGCDHGPTRNISTRGYYFRGRFVSHGHYVWDDAAERASRQGREWWSLDRKNEQRRWAVEQWEAAAKRCQNTTPSPRFSMIPEPCACGNKRGISGWTRPARPREYGKNIWLCWPCWMKYRKQEKREQELADLSRDFFRLKKEIANARKNSHDRRAS